VIFKTRNSVSYGRFQLHSIRTFSFFYIIQSINVMTNAGSA